MMPQRSRYTVEQKVKLVEEYLSGKLSPSEFTRIYRSRPRVLQDWVQLYEMRGIEGLTPTVNTRRYTPEIKRSAVLEYLNSGKRQIITASDVQVEKVYR